MKRFHRILVGVCGVALALGVGGAPVATADVAPVRRVSCPSVAAVNRGIAPSTEKRQLATVEATTTTCRYETKSRDGYLVFRFYPNVSTLKQVEDTERASYPPEFQYLFQPLPLPALGAGAFLFGDLGPVSAYWQLSPGAIAHLTTNLYLGPESFVRVAPLFRPMMEVYTIAGEHTVNGRKWRTTCEPYSATARCRTEIFATTIRRTAAGYQSVNGWTFNSLTYRWSDRALWTKNPLGHTGAWTTTEGRQWRTECDTTVTGRGACRSYVRATVIARHGSTYTQETKWVFNNQVLFNS